MKLTKENVYINLQGKSKEDLTEVNNILDYFKQVKRRDNIIEYFDEHYDCFNYLHFYNYEWVADTDFFCLKEKQEVTIEQLKEILQPIEAETLQEKEQRLLKELEEVRKEIEENKIKVGDWVWNNFSECYYKKYSCLPDIEERKITNPELIKLLEQEIK